MVRIGNDLVVVGGSVVVVRAFLPGLSRPEIDGDYLHDGLGVDALEGVGEGAIDLPPVHQEVVDLGFVVAELHGIAFMLALPVEVVHLGADAAVSTLACPEEPAGVLSVV